MYVINTSLVGNFPARPGSSEAGRPHDWTAYLRSRPGCAEIRAGSPVATGAERVIVELCAEHNFNQSLFYPGNPTFSTRVQNCIVGPDWL